MAQNFATRDKFRAHFVAKTLFETLSTVLEKLRPEHEVEVADQWRQAFRFVSDFFPPRNFLRRRTAQSVEARIDVLRVCERFLAVPGLSAAERCNGVKIILGMTNRDGQPLSVHDLLDVLAELKPLCGASADAVAEFEGLLRQLLVWFVSDQEFGLGEADSLALLKLLNDRDVGLELGLTSKTYVLAQAYRKHPQRLMSDVDTVLGDAFNGGTYLPQGHLSRGVVGGDHIPPLADALFTFLVTETGDADDGGGGHILGDLIVAAADTDTRTASQAVKSAASVRRFIAVLATEVNTSIEDVGLDALTQMPISEFSIFELQHHGIGRALQACTAVDNPGALLNDPYNRNLFILELLRSRPANDIKAVFEREPNTWAEDVARGLRTETNASASRLSFMNSVEPDADAAFAELHVLYDGLAVVINRCIQIGDFDPLQTHVAETFCAEGSVHRMELTSVCKMLVVLFVYHEHWEDIEVVQPALPALQAMDALGWDDAEMRIIDWVFAGADALNAAGPGADLGMRKSIATIFAESSGDTEAFRAFAVNMLALSVGAGVQDHRNLIQMMMFNPKATEGTWVIGCHGMRYVRAKVGLIFVLPLAWWCPPNPDAVMPSAFCIT